MKINFPFRSFTIKKKSFYYFMEQIFLNELIYVNMN